MLDVDKKSAKRRAAAQIGVVQGILRAWDPLNLSPGQDDWPADEYDAYAWQIVSMVRAGCSQQALAEHLQRIEVDAMALPPSPPEVTLTLASDILAALGKVEEGLS